MGSPPSFVPPPAGGPPASFLLCLFTSLALFRHRVLGWWGVVGIGGGSGREKTCVGVGVVVFGMGCGFPGELRVVAGVEVWCCKEALFLGS